RVTVFNAAGEEVVGRVSAVDRDGLEIAVEQRRMIAPPGGGGLTLAAAMPKGARGDWIIEKTAELGVSAVWPLQAARGLLQPGAKRLDKWRRIAREANKQSGRHFVMQLGESLDVAQLAGRLADFDAAWLTDSSGADPSSVGVAERGQDARRMLAIVGPEGGFEHDEIARLRSAGAALIRLGPHMLRVETAAIAAAAVWAARMSARVISASSDSEMNP
ncbi:MAG: 16S rRNA (uracil(1498)-N(3))-methyltransferase, partial [Phycisphaerae bacterium]